MLFVGGDPDEGQEEEDEEEDESSDESDGEKVGSGLYNPSDYAHLDVSSEIKDLFQYIQRYKPQKIDLETRLKPFIPGSHPLSTALSLVLLPSRYPSICLFIIFHRLHSCRRRHRPIH
jgi:hypothetical protein